MFAQFFRIVLPSFGNVAWRLGLHMNWHEPGGLDVWLPTWQALLGLVFWVLAKKKWWFWVLVPLCVPLPGAGGKCCYGRVCLESDCCSWQHQTETGWWCGCKVQCALPVGCRWQMFSERFVTWTLVPLQVSDDDGQYVQQKWLGCCPNMFLPFGDHAGAILESGAGHFAHVSS